MSHSKTIQKDFFVNNVKVTDTFYDSFELIFREIVINIGYSIQCFGPVVDHY